ncbi:MAG: uracil-DNA glycosylase [Erysipelotrichaceae bacterium]
MNSWQTFFEQEQRLPYYAALMEQVELAYAHDQVFPPKAALFAAFEMTPLDQVRVVIVGQDPYHDEHQAHGLAFSVEQGPNPPSLRNIFKLLEKDTGIVRTDGNLTDWATQGVLLLNRVLSVKAHTAGSHKTLGWQMFTQHVIEYLNEHCKGLVFVLWGKEAQEVKPWIEEGKHSIVESVHPSPLAAHRGFFESGCFRKIDAYLQQQGGQRIDWRDHGK